jgi:hypothetical protein
MPNLGAPELIILLLVLVVPVTLLILVLTGVWRTNGRGRSPNAHMPPGWYQDPAARHPYRYWDGLSWTATVSDGAATTSDPL